MFLSVRCAGYGQPDAGLMLHYRLHGPISFSAGLCVADCVLRHRQATKIRERRFGLWMFGSAGRVLTDGTTTEPAVTDTPTQPDSSSSSSSSDSSSDSSDSEVYEPLRPSHPALGSHIIHLSFGGSKRHSRHRQRHTPAEALLGGRNRSASLSFGHAQRLVNSAASLTPPQVSERSRV